VTNEDRRQTASESRQKLHVLQRIAYSKIIEWKFTKCVHNVPGLLGLKLLKSTLQLANLLLNARANSKGRFWQRRRTSLNFNWLLLQRPLDDCQTNVKIIIHIHMPTKRVK